MSSKINLSERWIKASILGTIWAASEIVLGSFLHNLKVPFGGNILTGIAIMILISVSFVWTERGLFWRAGLICAIMKSMSPSSVIFEPMIAIFSEALLLEFSVRIFGHTYTGYILGAVLAMSWNLVQKILSLILFYGYNIVNLYSQIIEIVQKQLSLNFNILWLPVIILAVVQIVLGIISAIIGIKIGRKLLLYPQEHKQSEISDNFSNLQRTGSPDFHYSLIWLASDILLIIGALILLNHTFWLVWTVSTVSLISMWAIRYKNAFQRLLKLKFWIFFFLLTMISAAAFSNINSVSSGLQNGMLIGLQMNLRAAIIILGFAALGTELYNPEVRRFFMKTSFKQLPLALELSFKSLPSIISEIPDLKVTLKNPVSVIYQIVSQADYRLNELKSKNNFNQKVFVLTGALGQGKTTQIQYLISNLKEKEINIGGIYSPRVTENDTTVGYDIVDIRNNEREVFLRINGDRSYEKIGRYYIYPSGLQKGISALNPAVNTKNKIVIIDEVGSLELGNKGWANSIQKLVDENSNHILLVVRDCFTEKITGKWNFDKSYVYNISGLSYAEICDSILKHLNE